jgi:hypothetical protein
MNCSDYLDSTEYPTTFRVLDDEFQVLADGYRVLDNGIRVLGDALWVIDDPGVLHQHRLLRLADFFTWRQIKLSHTLISKFLYVPDTICVPLRSHYPRLLHSSELVARMTPKHTL